MGFSFPLYSLLDSLRSRIYLIMKVSQNCSFYTLEWAGVCLRHILLLYSMPPLIRIVAASARLIIAD